MLSALHIHINCTTPGLALPSCLQYFFIPPEFSVPPFLFSVYRTLYYLKYTYYPYCLISIGASFGIQTLTETILRAQRKERFVVGARGGSSTMEIRLQYIPSFEHGRTVTLSRALTRVIL